MLWGPHLQANCLHTSNRLRCISSVFISAVRFSIHSVLLFSRPRSVGLPTPSAYFLHLPLSSVILTDSSTESPVHVLMLSIQAVRGLPRLRAPGIVPCIISFSRQLPVSS